MGIYKRDKHIRWKECKRNIYEEFNIQQHRCQNFELPKNIYFVRTTYRDFDTNVSIYRSGMLYSQNVKAELTANVTPKLHIIVF